MFYISSAIFFAFLMSDNYYFFDSLHINNSINMNTLGIFFKLFNYDLYRIRYFFVII